MANPYAQAPAPRTRPTTVTVSSYLLYGVAAVQLINAIIGLSVVGTMSRVLSEAYQGTTAEGAEAVAVGTSVAGAVVSLLIGAGLAVLAVFNNRGRQGSRITTWVVGGIGLCCSGLGLLGNAASRSLSLDSGNGGPSATEVQRQLNDALPSWYPGTTILLTVISLLALLAVIILLALPASNEFFRRPVPAWDPSQPYGGLPYGAQPPYPGSYGPPQQPYAAQPPYPGQPQYPPPPGSVGPGSAPPGPWSPGSAPPGWTPPGATPPGPNPPGSAPPASGPHPGTVPPTDPWSSPSDGERPPADPPSQG